MKQLKESRCWRCSKIHRREKVSKECQISIGSYYWYRSSAPIGNNIDEDLVGLQTGANGVSDITLFDPEQHLQICCEVKNLQSENFIEAKESKR